VFLHKSARFSFVGCRTIPQIVDLSSSNSPHIIELRFKSRSRIAGEKDTMTDEINEKEIESAVFEGFVAWDQENHSAIINFDPNDPKFELKRALGLKAALESRGYKVQVAGLDRLYGRSVSGSN